MAAPEFVPLPEPSFYESTPRRGSWLAERPGEIQQVGQPSDPGLGVQGPDQGYALRLVRQFEGRLELQPGEHEADAIAGCVGVALKRAALYGRAPVLHDLTIAFTVWGFLDSSPPEDLVAWRTGLFEGLEHVHSYTERRDIVDLVPAESLRATPAQVQARYAENWRALFDAVPFGG